MGWGAWAVGPKALQDPLRAVAAGRFAVSLSSEGGGGWEREAISALCGGLLDRGRVQSPAAARTGALPDPPPGAPRPLPFPFHGPPGTRQATRARAPPPAPLEQRAVCALPRRPGNARAGEGARRLPRSPRPQCGRAGGRARRLRAPGRACPLRRVHLLPVVTEAAPKPRRPLPRPTSLPPRYQPGGLPARRARPPSPRPGRCAPRPERARGGSPASPLPAWRARPPVEARAPQPLGYLARPGPGPGSGRAGRGRGRAAPRAPWEQLRAPALGLLGARAGGGLPLRARLPRHLA